MNDDVLLTDSGAFLVRFLPALSISLSHILTQGITSLLSRGLRPKPMDSEYIVKGKNHKITRQ